MTPYTATYFSPKRYSKHLVPYTYHAMIVENPKNMTDMETMYSPAIPRLEPNAALVRAPASSPGSCLTPERRPPEASQNPVTIRTRPVIVHTTIVTMNVPVIARSEEHTSELQSRFDLVCRLLLAKTK